MKTSEVNHRITELEQEIAVQIIWSRYNYDVVKMLKKSCIDNLKKISRSFIKIEENDVPGAYEIPVLAKNLILTKQPDVVIALGAIIRGETAHFEIVANSCSHSLASLSISYGLPIIFGVLTVESLEQATYRADPNQGDKGREAAYIAVEMVQKIRSLN